MWLLIAERLTIGSSKPAAMPIITGIGSTACRGVATTDAALPSGGLCRGVVCSYTCSCCLRHVCKHHLASEHFAVCRLPCHAEITDSRAVWKGDEERRCALRGPTKRVGD